MYPDMNVRVPSMATTPWTVSRPELTLRLPLALTWSCPAAAIVKAFERDAARGQIINVGTGVGVTIRQIIEAICHELGRPLSGVSIVEEAGTVGDSRNSVADISRARLVLGFEPAFMLADGLRTLLRERAPRS